MKKYEIRYYSVRRPLDSMPAVVRQFPFLAHDDIDARKKLEVFRAVTHVPPIKIVGLREVTYRKVPLE
jgi:hypothetical protein